MNEADSSEEVSELAIREELSRILQSSVFVQSERLGRFLRFAIESVLAHKSDSLKEYVIGTEVYDRRPPYHPTQDSIVRTEARRLRSKLKEYYEGVGSADPVLIYFRPGSYVPVFRLREALVRETVSPTTFDGELLVEGKGISIAVIPFKDLSGLPASSTCALAITDELIHELMRTDGCRVTSASSANLLDQFGSDLPALARRLGVQIFFEGSVRQHGPSLRITARIVTADGFQLWSQRFETEPNPDELFALSEQIARSMIARTRPELSSVRKLKASVGSVIWNNYSFVLSAEASVDEGTPADIKLAVTKLEEVLAVSPVFPRPLCDIAQCYYELALRGVDISAESIGEAKKKAMRAVELDPELMQAHGCIAALLQLEWNWKAAERSFHHALSLGSHAATFRQYALFLTVQGRFDEAFSYLQHAQSLDPFSGRQKLAWIRFFHVSRRYQEIDRYSPERLIYGLRPAEASLYLAFVYLEIGRIDDARRLALEAQKYSGMQPTVAACLAELLARCGQEASSKQLVDSLKLFSAHSGITKFRQVLLATALGDTELALSYLSAAFNEREPELIWTSVDPRLDLLRSDPTFISIAERVMSVDRT